MGNLSNKEKKAKKAKIKRLINEMLKESHKSMISKIDKALDSGALDIENWDENVSPMIIPKVVTIALLEDRAYQYRPPYEMERKMKKEVKNLRYFI